MSLVTHETRQLAARADDGVHIRLLWDPRENAVTVSVEDSRGARNTHKSEGIRCHP